MSTVISKREEDIIIQLKLVYTALRKLREWHKSEYQSDPKLDATVDAVLTSTEYFIKQL